MKSPTDQAGFLISLPERAGRALIALGGGVVVETVHHLLPRGLRRTRLYDASLGRLLRIVVEGVGGVEDVFGPPDMPLEQLLLRKAAGNAAEAAALVAVGWSPLWLLAATADISGGTRQYLTTLVDGLVADGVLQPGAQIDRFTDLLQALEGTSGVLAETLDLPPTTVVELRTTWQRLVEQQSALPGPQELALVFSRLSDAAQREGRSLLEVSALVAAAALRTGAQLGTTEIFASYGPIFDRIRQIGLAGYLQQLAVPYLVGAARHFDSTRPSWTERLISWFHRRRS